ncbi:MAG TPA: hypothetical protein PLD54_02165 [Candidatus Levybacteria bacterium]|nr:hypothetical protein [Candidatus Levybacteria bacterium]
MRSLAEITRETRLISKFAAIGSVVILFLFVSFHVVRFIIGIINPPVVPPPGMKYGPLISNLPIQSSKPVYSYHINTITGSLPTVPDRLRVYKALQPESDLLALQKARETVRLKGYISGETVVTPGEYRWNNATGGSIIYNIQSKNFQFSSGIGLEKQDYTFSSISNINTQVFSFIQDFNASLLGIDQQNPTITYFQSDGVNLIPEKDPSKAYLALINYNQINVTVDPFIFRTDKPQTIETLPIYYQTTDTTNQSFLIKAGGRLIQFVRGNYKNYQVDTTDFSTYPLKTSEQAFEDLQNGNAYILSTSKDTAMSITEMTLGYFIPQTAPEYIMPIFIFKGKDFIAYVHAIGEYVSPNQNVSN